MRQRAGYSGTQIVFHWAIAALILFNYIYSEGMGKALHFRLEGGTPTDGFDLNPQIHVVVGILIFALCLIRLVLRGIRGVPAPGGHGLMQRAAHWGHLLLYALMILVPVAGGLAWFGRIDAFGDVHSVLANALMIVAGGHAVMAIYHQYFLRDGLLGRMMRPDDA